MTPGQFSKLMTLASMCVRTLHRLLQKINPHAPTIEPQSLWSITDKVWGYGRGRNYPNAFKLNFPSELKCDLQKSSDALQYL